MSSTRSAETCGARTGVGAAQLPPVKKTSRSSAIRPPRVIRSESHPQAGLEAARAELAVGIPEARVGSRQARPEAFEAASVVVVEDVESFGDQGDPRRVGDRRRLPF